MSDYCPLYPESGHVRCNSVCPLCANSGHRALFDHLVGTGEQRRRYGEAEQPRGLGVDHQLKRCRLYDWQVRRLRALEDATGIGAHRRYASTIFGP